MDAQRLERHRHATAVSSQNFTGSDEPADLRGDVVGSAQYRAWLASRHEGAIRTVPAIGEGFGGERVVQLRCRHLHRRACTAKQP